MQDYCSSPKGFLQALISLVFVFLKLKLTTHITRRGLLRFSRTAESNQNEKFANWTKENFEDFFLPILSKTDAINRTVRD